VIIGKANLSDGRTSAATRAQRFQRRRPPVPQSAHSRRNPCGSSSGSGAATRSPYGRGARYGNRRSIVCPADKTVSLDQAHGWLDEPRGRRADLSYAGHSRDARPLAR
jgi:hypothetical protein